MGVYFAIARAESARNATNAFAEFCGISYERACDIAMEIL